MKSRSGDTSREVIQSLTDRRQLTHAGLSILPLLDRNHITDQWHFSHLFTAGCGGCRVAGGNDGNRTESAEQALLCEAAVCWQLVICILRMAVSHWTNIDCSDYQNDSINNSNEQVRTLGIMKGPQRGCMNSGLRKQVPTVLNSITCSFSIVEVPAKSLLFASRQNTLILHLCVFIPVLNVPFRTLTLNNPFLHATTGPDVWLRLSPVLYSWTGPQLGQKARV